MRIRRKTHQCLNCGYTLDNVYNYCPNCGQDNTDNNVSFNTLLGDFFDTYFALDSKFAKTIKPFFFQPGKLTNLYVDGKRASYSHPLRLYLIISLFYFFIFTMVGKQQFKDNNEPMVKAGYNIKGVDELDRKTRKQIERVIPKSKLRKVAEDMDGEDLEDLQKALDENLTQTDRDALKKELTHKQLVLIGLEKPDSTDNVKSKEIAMADSILEKQLSAENAVREKNKEENDDDKGSIFGRINWKLINDLKYNHELSDEDILDSMKLGTLSSTDRYLAMQSIRVVRADEEQFVEFLLKNIPLMMMVLIPIFALILKLLYIRRKKQLYIKHVIHALHLHSFAYFFYGISLIIMFYVLDGPARWVLFTLSFLIVSTYAFISFMRVYKQHWFKTLIKFNIAGYVYLFFIFFFLAGEMLISMLTY